jgi:type I restriction enzyme R subunit
MMVSLVCSLVLNVSPFITDIFPEQVTTDQIVDHQQMNLGAGQGIAVREFPLKNGPVDYLLFVDRKAVGIVEAKPEGVTLGGVAEQTSKYISDIPAGLPVVQEPLPFTYESTGIETNFRDMRDPSPCSRRVFAFHRPETLAFYLSQGTTLRAKLQHLPPLITRGLRDCQTEAIQNLEKSFIESKPRALIQMATGSGKTYTAVSSIYRLIKFAGAKRILFLVDRNNLGRQTLREFQEYVTPDDGRKFTELYNVQHLTSNSLDPVCKVCITTIQRLYSMLIGEAELDPTLEEQSGFDVLPYMQKPKEVNYNPLIPIENFDFIVTDECHRSIYGLWRQVLEYFDSFLIGLTATPSKQTLGFFNQNLVMEYNHARAVADAVNVGYEVYRIRTQITEQGSKVEAGDYVDKRDKLTRKKRWELLDEDLEYAAPQLDRSVVAPDQIRTVIRTFKDKLYTEIFPGRTEVPKTLVFAKDDAHAEDIVGIFREEFGKGNDFCKKITYRTTGEKPEDLIASFRNSYNPRIAVTVDMISTGTDIKPLECLLFMRDVKSLVYFEQMKGRGTRTISPTDFNMVTPNVPAKTHFVIVDAVGVCETDKTDTRPLERKKSVPFKQLITLVALGNRDEDMLTSLAARLAALELETNDKDRGEIQKAAQGKTLKQLVNSLMDATDPDKQADQAQQMFGAGEPTQDQLDEATEALTAIACQPFDDPGLRNTLIEIKQRNEQVIDTVSKDVVLGAGWDAKAKEKAQTVIDTFKKFIEDNKNEITALQFLYSRPYGARHLTYQEIKDLAEAIRKPPYTLTQEAIWQAYEQLEKSKVKGAGAQKLLTNIISLIRFTVGQEDVLEPFPETVNRRFSVWLSQQAKAGRTFNPEQMEWLRMIKEHIAISASIDVGVLELTPFQERGGIIKADNVFNHQLNSLLEELNGVLVA